MDQCRSHVDVASVHDCVHCHPQQVDHHLDEKVLFDSDKFRDVIRDVALDFDRLLLGVVLADIAELIEA